MERSQFLAGLCLALLAAALIAPVHAADKVGYINVQRIVSNSDLGKAGAAEINEMREASNAQIRQMNEDLNQLKVRFNEKRQQPDANEGELRTLLEDIELKDKQLKRYIDDAKESIAKKDRELVSTILRKADPVLKEIAKKRDFTVIIKDPNALAYLDPKVDLSDDVVSGLNKLD